MKLALGTVQFGLDYGAFGAAGLVNPSDISIILGMAQKAGIEILDTARAYGESEAVLGETGAPDVFRIVTKCPDLRDATNPANALKAAFRASCKALGVSNVYGYLLHNADNLDSPGVWQALSGLQKSGRATKIGVSCYHVDKLAELAERYDISLAQLPANVLDPWYKTQTLPKDIEIHTRSAFLQGFLLSAPDALPERFKPWSDALAAFHREAEAAGLTPLQASLVPLLQSPHIDRVIIGVDNAMQLREILDAMEKVPKLEVELGPFPGVTADLTDPRRWV